MDYGRVIIRNELLQYSPLKRRKALEKPSVECGEYAGSNISLANLRLLAAPRESDPLTLGDTAQSVE